MPTTTRSVRRLLLAAPLSLCLLLAGCFLQTSDDEAPDDETAPPAPSQPTAAGDGPVQDTWIYERVRTVADDGSTVDVTRDLVAGLEGDADAAVQLADGVTFTPVPALDARIRDDADGFREDLDVVAGVVETAQGRGLQIIATPTGDVSVEEDDLLVLDLSHLGLDPGAPLVVDFAFAQGLPADDDVEQGLTGAELLGARMADERFQWYAVAADDGFAPGLITVFGSVPGDGLAAGTSATGVATGGDGGVLRAQTADAVTVQTALARPTTTRATASGILPMPVPGFGGGGIPTKANPVIDPLGDLATCTDGPIDCLSDYFDAQEKGTQESVDKLFGDNMGGDGGGSRCGSNCGGKTGEPHVKTFDGVRYDLQLVGEFTLATAGELTVQTRTAPYYSSESVSVVTAVAVEIGEHRLTVRVGREAAIWLDGDPLPIAQARTGVDLDGSTAVAYGDALFIESTAGRMVEVRGLESGHLDIYVDPGDGTDEWTGLLGSPDGDELNDLTTRDGVVLDPEPSTDDLYGVFGESWRITDEASLFDYADGESTETFTDRSFPRRHMTIDDLTDRQRTLAEAVCRLAGIARTAQLEDCIFDYAVTGDMAFVRTSRYVDATIDPAADEWLAAIPDVEGLAGQPVLDQDGHVLVPVHTDDGGRLSALDVTTGEVAWTAPTDRAGCVAVTAAGDVVVPVEGEDGWISLGVLDPADGTQLAAAPTALRECDAMTVVGDVVVARDGDTLLGIDVALPEVRFELELEGLRTHPVAGGDGGVWLVREDGGTVTAERIDPATGESTVVPLPVTRVNKHTVATDDGLILSHRGEERGTGGLLRVTASGTMWQTSLPATFDGVTVDRVVSGPVSVGDGKVVAHLGSDDLGVFDLATGAPLRTIDHSSFSNNGDRQTVVDGLVVVGPMGSDHWVETWDLDSGRRAWTRPVPDRSGELKLHDAKRFGPRTPSGQVVVATSMAGGVAVALVGPGR